MGVEFLARGYVSGGNEWEPSIAFSLHPLWGLFCWCNLSVTNLLLSPLGHCCPNLMKPPPKKIHIYSLCLRTLQVQVFGSCGRLRGDLGINLDHVEVVGVPGDYDIMPVVVVQGLVWVAFDQVGSISQVGHIVQVTGTRYLTTWMDATKKRNGRTWKHDTKKTKNIAL